MSACSKLQETVASADGGDFFVQSLQRDCTELKSAVQVLGQRCLQAALDATLAAALLDGSNIPAAMQAWNEGARSASQPPHVLPPPNDRLMRVAAAYLAKHTSAKEAATRLSDLKGEQDRLVSERNAASARSQAAELALGETLAKMHTQSVQLATAESECASAKRAAAEATARADTATGNLHAPLVYNRKPSNTALPDKAHKAQLEVLPLQQRVAVLEGQVKSLTAQVVVHSDASHCAILSHFEKVHDEQDTARRAVVRADDCFRCQMKFCAVCVTGLQRGLVTRFRDKELALQELHISNTKCASVTAERDRLKDRMIEMELEVSNQKASASHAAVQTTNLSQTTHSKHRACRLTSRLQVADAMSQRHVAKTESAKVGAQLAAAEGWRQVRCRAW